MISHSREQCICVDEGDGRQTISFYFWLTLPERKDIDFEGGKRIFLNYIAEDERGMINPPEGELLNLYGSTF